MKISTEQETIAFLKECAEIYYNTDSNAIIDAEYDELYRSAELAYPNNEFFTLTGSPVRGAEIRHTSIVGGLEQVHDGELDKWKTRSNYMEEDLVISEKLDGSSLIIVYDKNGKLSRAQTRGDGIFGKDVTRHMSNLDSVPKIVNCLNGVEIRGEFIVKKSNFNNIIRVLLQVSGKDYVPGRGIANGLINSKEINPEVFQYLDFVAYSTNIEYMTKRETFNFLKYEGFLTSAYINLSHFNLKEDKLNDVLNKMRNDSLYEIDGVVGEYNEVEKRLQLGYNETSRAPKFAFKWKTRALDNIAETTVTDVQWNISKSGYWKPRVNFTPVFLAGANIEWASGFNAKFIIDNQVGPGSKILITRAGDVIPHIDSVLTPSDEPSFPPGNWSWTDTQVDAVSDDEHPEVHAKRLKHFFNTLETDNVQEATLQTLFEHNADTIEKIILFKRDQWNFAIGKNGEKAYDSLHAKLQNVYLWELMAAWPYFGRGFGKRRAKALTEAFGDEKVLSLTMEDIITVEGFQDKSGEAFLHGLETFSEFYDWLQKEQFTSLKKCDTIITSGKLQNVKFVFTGIRDKIAEAEIVRQGGEIQPGIKKDTVYLVVKDLHSTSNKMLTAKKAGIQIITLTELQELLK